MSPRQPSYEELQQTCEDLRRTAARAISLKQELIETKQALDAELGRYRQIQRYVERTLPVTSIAEFASLTTEQLVDSYGIEAALLLLGEPQSGKHLLSVVGQCGLSSCPSELPFDEAWLPAGDRRALSWHGADSRLVSEWPELQLQDALVCPLRDPAAQLQGALVAIRTVPGADFYPELPQESSIGVLAYQAGELLRNLQASMLIRRQVEELEHALAQQQQETAKRLDEERRRVQQEQIVSAQRETLRQLGTPVVPIFDGVIAIPLIGAVDKERASSLLDTVLTAISAQQANLLLIDVTGVPSLDSEVAELLLKATQAVRLLGADVLLSGIRAEVAQRLVALGAKLDGVQTTANFQTAIRRAWARSVRGPRSVARSR